jgi:predicted amidophosphoribosyltransferase
MGLASNPPDRVMLAHMGKHSERRRTIFGRRREERDNLFERSFQTCAGCGEDVYVLAEDCRECGRELELINA